MYLIQRSMNVLFLRDAEGMSKESHNSRCVSDVPCRHDSRVETLHALTSNATWTGCIHSLDWTTGLEYRN